MGVPNIEIENWRAINKNGLLGTFKVRLPGLDIYDCCLFQKKDGNGRVVFGPSERYQDKGGEWRRKNHVFIHEELSDKIISALDLYLKAEEEPVPF
jgi:hypothetical protein